MSKEERRRLLDSAIAREGSKMYKLSLDAKGIGDVDEYLAKRAVQIALIDKV